MDEGSDFEGESPPLQAITPAGSAAPMTTNVVKRRLREEGLIPPQRHGSARWTSESFFVHSTASNRFLSEVLGLRIIPALMPAEDAFDLEEFHAGSREVLGACYREHYAAVARAARQILPPVDAETVAHEVFHRLLSSPEMRASFRGGDLGAWLARVTKNLAIDHRRKYAREEPLEDDSGRERHAVATAPAGDGELDAAIVIERFKKEVLPPKYAAVFEARFLKQMDQRSAAAAVGIPRSTLVYQEQQIRALLRKFVLEQR